ncbi:AAA family ATPase [Streptomyces sp. NPDC002004]
MDGIRGSNERRSVLGVVGRVLGLLVCLSVAAVLIWSQVEKPADTTSAVATVVAALVSLGPAVVFLLRKHDVPGPSTDEELEAAAQALASALWEQWPLEAEKRGIVEASAAEVPWNFTGPLSVGVLARGATESTVGSPYEQRVVRNFTAAPSRRLVVTGEPGSGKSVHLLLLTLGLLRRREEGDGSEPVPVLVSVARWDSRKRFANWAEERLRAGYGFLDNARFGGTAIHGLLQTRRVVLVLDGLDELEESLREEVVEQLTSSPVQSWPLVIACTSDAMDALRSRPQLDFSAMRITTLKRLSVSKVVTFLRGGRTLQSTDAWWRPVRHALSSGTPGALADALSIPLYASLARSVYGPNRRAPDSLVDVARTGDVRTHLLRRFLEDAFTSPAPTRAEGRGVFPLRDWDGRRARSWLRSLARYLDGHHSKHLSWWCWHDMLGRRAAACVAGVLAALVYLLSSGFPEGLARGTPVGMALGLIVGVLRDRADGARLGALVGTACTVAIGAAALTRYGLAQAVHDGVELGVPLGVGVFLIGWMQRSVWRIAVGSAGAGLAAGCWAGAWDGLVQGPSAGVHRLLTTSLGMAISVAFTNVLVRATGSWSTPSQPTGVNAALRGRWRDLLAHLAVGATAGVAIGVGGGTVIVLRATLAHHGQEGVHRAAAVALTYGVTAVLAFGVTGAFMRWLGQPQSRERAASPHTTLAAARTMSLAYVVSATGLGAVVMSTAHALTSRAPLGLRADMAGMADYRQGAALGLCIGMVLAASFTPWPTFAVVRLVSWATRRLPLRLMSFLEDAHRAEVLRGEGAHYMFRHTEIRTCLLNNP